MSLRPHAVRAAALCALAICTAPLLALAQTQSADLSSTIRAELLSDPRTSTFTEAQLDSIVAVLTQQAQTEGITPAKIAWRPGLPPDFGAVVPTPASTDACSGVPEASCLFDKAFGFVGPDYVIPYTLGAASMGLIWVLAEMLHRRRYPVPATSAPANSAA